MRRGKRVKLRILAIDQGSRKCGWAVVQDKKIIASGVWKLRQDDRYDRYLTLISNLEDIIDSHKPHIIAIENIYLKRSGHMNVKTTIIMGETRGIIISVGIRRHIAINDVNPSMITKWLSINPRMVDKKVAAIKYMNHYTGRDDYQEDEADAAIIGLLIDQGYNGLEQEKADGE